jgi:hypothetical protein
MYRLSMLDHVRPCPTSSKELKLILYLLSTVCRVVNSMLKLHLQFEEKELVRDSATRTLQVVVSSSSCAILKFRGSIDSAVPVGGCDLLGCG